MSRTYRALTTLALSLALVAATAAVAAAAEDLNGQREALYRSELEHNLAVQAAGAQAARTQAAVERARALERQSGAVAAAPAAEDQNDRLLRGIETAAAERTQAAVERVRAGERELGPAPVVTIAAQPVPAATCRDVDLIAIALLALVGGLLGGAAWTAASRRRPNRTVAA
jgi:hypothetical protein